MWLLLPAAFFHGYDAALLAVLLPDIQSSFGVSEATLGLSRIPIELGLAAGFAIGLLADRVGRRPVLLGSVLGYTVFTALTSVAPEFGSFVALQFLTRVFLAAELTVAIVVVVEEFPAGRRARALGTLLAAEALGPIAVALLLAGGLGATASGWRGFFLVSLLVLVPLVVARRGLRETERFASRTAARPGWREAWRSARRPALLAVGTVYLLRSVPVFGGTAWWAFYAQRERGFTDLDVALYLICAYGLGCLGYLACGRLMVRIGYRPTAVAFLIGAALASVVLFQTGDRIVAFVALLAAVAFGLGCAPVLAGFASEPFPTELRGQAGSWVRSGFELPGFVIGPALVGVLGDPRTGPIGSIGDTVALLAVLLLPAAYVVWRYLPETAGRELEEIAR